MTGRFNEEKATQIAGMLLKMGGNKMYYLKLIKLMYLIDREGLLRWGWSMTNDEYKSMDHGCVLSKTLNLITQESLGGHVYWKKFISAPQAWQIELINEPETDELSDAERELIEEQYKKFQEMFGHLGDKDRWKLADYTHDLPEYKDPDGSSLPIAYEDVLVGANIPQEEALETVYSLEECAQFERLLTR